MAVKDTNHVYRTKYQLPLDVRYFAPTLDYLRNITDEQARTFWNGMMVFVAEDGSIWRWQEMSNVPSDTTVLLDSNYTYPTCWKNEYYDYSGKEFNFVRLYLENMFYPEDTTLESRSLIVVDDIASLKTYNIGLDDGDYAVVISGVTAGYVLYKLDRSYSGVYDDDNYVEPYDSNGAWIKVSNFINEDNNSKKWSINVDRVDGFDASGSPTANTILPLNNDGKYPNSVLYTGHGNGFDADTVDGKHASDLLDKTTYDSNNDGKVNAADNADNLGGVAASDYMRKSVYDTNGDGIVNNSELLNGYATRNGAGQGYIPVADQLVNPDLSADTVDDIHASTTPTANQLLALGANAMFTPDAIDKNGVKYKVLRTLNTTNNTNYSSGTSWLRFANKEINVSTNPEVTSDDLNVFFKITSNVYNCVDDGNGNPIKGSDFYGQEILIANVSMTVSRSGVSAEQSDKIVSGFATGNYTSSIDPNHHGVIRGIRAGNANYTDYTIYIGVNVSEAVIGGYYADILIEILSYDNIDIRNSVSPSQTGSGYSALLAYDTSTNSGFISYGTKRIYDSSIETIVPATSMLFNENGIQFYKNGEKTTISGGAITSTQGDITASNGNMYANDFIQNSDIRLKADVKDIDDSVVVDKLRPVKFHYNDTEREQFGFIAQEVMEIFPELVYKNERGYFAFSPISLIAILVKEVKELKKKVKKLEENDLFGF